MDWKSLGGTLAKTGFPIIGAALGGPLGGTIGGVVGGIVASALGVDNTPEAVNTAITTGDPAVVNAALAKAEAEVSAKWATIEAIAKAEAEVNKVNIEQINETMRAEIDARVPWWHWRHLIGYATLLWIIGPLPPIVYHMWVGNITVLNALVAAVVSLVPIIAISAGLNGWVAQDNTKRAVTAMTGEPPQSATAAIVKAIVKKK